MDKQNDPGQPGTAKVLAEIEQRRATRERLENKSTRKLVILADRFIFWLSSHWLVIFNTLAFLYVAPSFLAPVLMHLGAEVPARILYTLYHVAGCHQLPQRSWFLFGPQITYTLPEFGAQLGESILSDPLAWGGFTGNEALGYKVAFCQRCTATYGAIFLSGLVYGLLRSVLGWEIKPLRWWVYIGLGIVPMGLDGGYQFLSYALPLLIPSIPISPHETTALMRVVTGVLFGWATVWLAYPYVEETMDDIRWSLQRRFGWGSMINEQ
jgi:uncharacterized membrane protein